MIKNKIKIAVVLYTYDRTDDVRVNQEIIRYIWPCDQFNIKIIHCFNGQKKWYPEKYLEDDLVRLKNSGHFQGAAELIDAGIAIVSRKYSNFDYVVVLAADTWLIKADYITRVITEMQKGGKYLATCPWGLPERNKLFEVGMAVDFYVLDYQWSKKQKMFPIRYADFYRKYGELIVYQFGGNVMLEKLTLARFMQAIVREFPDNNGMRSRTLEKMRVLSEREPVHSHIAEGNWIRTHYWPKMGLLTHHDLLPKQQIIKKFKGLPRQAKHLNKLVQANELSYFNANK